jgi:hypothetical protein
MIGMMRNEDWNLCYVSLVSKAKPKLRDGRETQGHLVWQVLSELTEKHGHRLTLKQIVERCEYRGYAELLKEELSVRRSVIWHLTDWADPQHKIIEIEF